MKFLIIREFKRFKLFFCQNIKYFPLFIFFFRKNSLNIFGIIVMLARRRTMSDHEFYLKDHELPLSPTLSI